MQTGFMADVQKERVTARLAIRFVCSKCREIMEGKENLIKKLCYEVETVHGFYYLGDKLNSNGGCEVAVKRIS